MTIQEISLTEMKEIYDPSSKFYICCDVPQNFVYFDNYSSCPVLIPRCSRERTAGLISSEEFKRKYKIQINNSTGSALISYLKNQPTSVYLVTNVETGALMSVVNSI